jgi:peptide/nickel transport system permease protein
VVQVLEHRPARRFDPSRRAALAAWIGVGIVALNLFLAVFGRLLAPYTPGEFVTAVPFAPPGGGLLLGSDYLGRDVYSRLLAGASLTIGLSMLSTVVGYAIGMPIGFIAAVVGGWVDGVLSRAAELFMSVPPILLALLLATAFGSSFSVLILIVGLIHAPRVVRVARAIAANIAVLEFVEVARARGEHTWSIVRREIWPNALRPLMAEFGIRLTFSVLLVSSMSFIGIGLPPPTSDWGSMVRENLGGLYYGSFAVLLPALAIGALAIGINVIVDWLAASSGRDLSEGFV